MPDSIELTLLLTEEPKRVFNAWMDPREHAQFTGGGLATIEPWTGGRFTAFEGDVHGIFLGVDPAARIVQTFRTPEFSPETRDSRLTVLFEQAQGGTRLRIVHSDVPPNLVRKMQKVWESSYIKPLSKYFIKPPKGAKGAKAAAPAKKAAEKPAARKAPASAKKVARPASAKAVRKAARPASAKAAHKVTRPAAKKARLKIRGQRRSSRS
jgi:uncharacterized protein YndB with AHSA1/START domain